MQNDEWLRELKREFYKEIDEMKRRHQSFKLRISVISNIFIPGIGFVVYGKFFSRGITSFVLFSLYNILFFNKILPNTDVGVAFIYYIPAIIIWIISTFMVAVLED